MKGDETMFDKTIKKEVMRIIKDCDDEELIDFIYLVLLKNTQACLATFELFGFNR